MPSGNWLKHFPRKEFCELIASGRTETQALEVINTTRELEGKSPWDEAVVVQLQIKRPEFRENLEDAKRKRADYWFDGIAKSVAKEISKDEVPAEKLKFEQRKYMAAIDNPEKYSEKHRMDVSLGINIFQEIKELPTSEVSKLLKSADPFSAAEGSDVVDAEYEEIDGGVTPACGQGPEEEIESEEDEIDIFD